MKRFGASYGFLPSVLSSPKKSIFFLSFDNSVAETLFWGDWEMPPTEIELLGTGKGLMRIRNSLGISRKF
jgi:hypothetical protein